MDNNTTKVRKINYSALNRGQDGQDWDNGCHNEDCMRMGPACMFCIHSLNTPKNLQDRSNEFDSWVHAQRDKSACSFRKLGERL